MRRLNFKNCIIAVPLFSTLILSNLFGYGLSYWRHDLIFFDILSSDISSTNIDVVTARGQCYKNTAVNKQRYF